MKLPGSVAVVLGSAAFAVCAVPPGTDEQAGPGRTARPDPRTAMYDDGCRGDCLAYEIKLNCQDRIRRAAVRAIGEPRFESRSRTATRVSFDGTQNAEAWFTWRSFFTVPDSPFPSREHSFVCTGSGRSGASISGWRIINVELN